MAVGAEDLAAIFVLDSLKGFGPVRFRRLWEAGVRAREVIERPEVLPVKGKQDEAVREQLLKLDSAVREKAATRATKQLETAAKASAELLTYDDKAYPKVLHQSRYPLPVLYVRGDVGALSSKTVACVGSRGIRPPYDRALDEFAATAAKLGSCIVSGFALGADSIAHRRALAEKAPTVGVMAGGLDRPFPPENKELWAQMLASEGACFVSEMGFGIRASSMNLRKRNKLIVALSRGVMVGQTAVKGGAMNAYRFAVEERRPIATFAADGKEDSAGNAFMEHDEKAQALVTSLPITNSRDRWGTWLRQL